MLIFEFNLHYKDLNGHYTSLSNTFESISKSNPNQDYLGGSFKECNYLSMLKIARNKTLSRCAVNDGLVTFNLF